MIISGRIEIYGNAHEFGYERDEKVIGLKYKITDLTTRLTIWCDDNGQWHQKANGNASLSQETLEKVIAEIVINP